MSGMLGKSSHHATNWVSTTLFEMKKYPLLPLLIYLQKHPPCPFEPNVWKKLFLFQMASLNRVLLGTRYYMNSKRAWWSWTYHTCHRRTRWPCYVLLSPFRRTFLKGEIKGGGYFFEKFNRCRWDLIFFMVGALIWHVWNAKSQSTVFLLRSNESFRWGYTIIDLVSSSRTYLG